MSEGLRPEDRLTTGPAPQADLTTRPAVPTAPTRRDGEIVLPCGRCRHDFPVVELGRLWRLPALLVYVFGGYYWRNEAVALYCPSCRRLLNWCLMFLMAIFAFGALAMSGVLPAPRR